MPPSSPREDQLKGATPKDGAVRGAREDMLGAQSQERGALPDTATPTRRTKAPLTTASSPSDSGRDVGTALSRRHCATASPRSAKSLAGAESARTSGGEGSALATPRVGSSGLGSPLPSYCFAASPQQQGLSEPLPHRGSGRAANAPPSGAPLSSSSHASSLVASGSVAMDYVDVVVRLKPPLKRVADAYMRYTIETAPLSSPPRTGRGGGPQAEKASARSTYTPRTARVVVDGTAPQHSVRAPRTARNTGTPSRSPLMSSPTTNSQLPTGCGATGRVLTLDCPVKAMSGGSLPGGGGSGGSSGGEERRSYEFGEVLDGNVSDAEMCERLVPGILAQLAAGYNACVLCYGQTGSGKTHTIAALVPFLTDAVFQSINQESDVVEVSYIQIYNDRAYDLLSRGSSREEYGMPLPRPMGSTVCEPKVFVRSASAALKKVADAQKLRCTGTHPLNARSSRSHTLFSLHITRCLGGVPLTTNKVTLADLAGSERVKRTGAQGEELSEAIHINKSLHTLHAFIVATAADSEVLPYRESLLTRYLAPRLKEWHILLIVTASLEKRNAAETRTSLDFATTARRCVVTKRKPRSADRIKAGSILAADPEELREQWQAVVAALRQRVGDLEERLAASKDANAVPAAVMRDMKRQVETYKSLLHEREEDLLAIRAQIEQPPPPPEQQRGGNGGDTVTAILMEEVAERESMRERTLELLSRLRARVQPPVRRGVDSGAEEEQRRPEAVDEDLVDGLHETFLWFLAQLHAVHEQYRVLERAADGLRTDNGRLASEVQGRRKELAALEATAAAVRAAAQAAEERAARQLQCAHDRYASCFLGLARHTVRGEMAGLYGCPDALSASRALGPWVLGTGSAEAANGIPGALAGAAQAVPSEEKERHDSMAAELAGYTRSLHELQREFDAKERSRLELEAELNRCSQMLHRFWDLATPTQKAQLLQPSSTTANSGGGGAGTDAPSSALPAFSCSRSGSGAPSVGESAVGVLRGSGAAGLAHGLTVERLKGELRALRQQLASVQAETENTKREQEEAQRTVEELRTRNGKLAALMGNSYELMRNHAEELKRADAKCSALYSEIDAHKLCIDSLKQEVVWLEGLRADAHREILHLSHENKALCERMEGLKQQGRQYEHALALQEREAATRLAAVEEADKAQLRKLEWRVQQLLSRTPSAGDVYNVNGGNSKAPSHPIHTAAATGRSAALASATMLSPPLQNYAPRLIKAAGPLLPHASPASQPTRAKDVAPSSVRRAWGEGDSAAAAAGKRASAERHSRHLHRSTNDTSASFAPRQDSSLSAFGVRPRTSLFPSHSADSHGPRAPVNGLFAASNSTSFIDAAAANPQARRRASKAVPARNGKGAKAQ